MTMMSTLASSDHDEEGISWAYVDCMCCSISALGSSVCVMVSPMHGRHQSVIIVRVTVRVATADVATGVGGWSMQAGVQGAACPLGA